MGELASRRFERPDETRSFEHGKGYVVHLAEATAAKSTLEPGWRWSTSVKPIAGTDSCQAHHVGYALGGTLHIRSDEGEDMEVHAGEAYEILPGHDAWVVGDQPYSGLEFESATAERYAKKER
jgi:hypothetical protein